MDTAAAQWPQEIVGKPMEEIVACPKPESSVERKVRPQKDQTLNCPRCNSTNTKFCYYNNYSLSQPRYFCKTCRRYWTEGGSLRNIPVGGGSRKNKRSPSLSAKKLPDLVPPPLPQQNPNPKIMDAVTTQDLNLGFSSHHHEFKSIAEMIHIPNFEGSTKLELQNNNPSSSSSTSSANSSHHLSSLELLTGLSSTPSTSRGLSPFAPLPTPTDLNNTVYSSSGFSFNPLGGGADHHSQFKPSLNFSLDGLGSSGGYSSFPETTGKLLFPFEDLKQVSSGNTSDHQNGDHQPGDSTGYWNRMMGGGPW